MQHDPLWTGLNIPHAQWTTLVLRFVAFAHEVDINGDGMMEWDEFTRFVVVKAQLHHAQMSIDQLAEYRQGSRQVRIDLSDRGKSNEVAHGCTSGPLNSSSSPSLVRSFFNLSKCYALYCRKKCPKSGVEAVGYPPIPPRPETSVPLNKTSPLVTKAVDCPDPLLCEQLQDS